jgi:hypothetical protein
MNKHILFPPFGDRDVNLLSFVFFIRLRDSSSSNAAFAYGDQTPIFYIYIYIYIFFGIDLFA